MKKMIGLVLVTVFTATLGVSAVAATKSEPTIDAKSEATESLGIRCPPFCA